MIEEDDGRSFSHIQAMIQANGEFDKLVQGTRAISSLYPGVFENYLKCKITDLGTTGRIVKAKIEQACNWLRFYDDLDHLVNTRQCHEFMGYMGYPVVKFHQLFASANLKFRVEYPRSGYQASVDCSSSVAIRGHQNKHASGDFIFIWIQCWIPKNVVKTHRSYRAHSFFFAHHCSRDEVYQYSVDQARRKKEAGFCGSHACGFRTEACSGKRRRWSLHLPS